MQNAITLLFFMLVLTSCGSFDGWGDKDNSVAVGRVITVSVHNGTSAIPGLELGTSRGSTWDFLKCGDAQPWSDPRVVYDAATDLFYYTVMYSSTTGSGVTLSLAPGNDQWRPSVCYNFDGLQKFFRLPLSGICATTPSACFADQPWLVVTSNKIAINARPIGSSDPATTQIINKDDAVNSRSLRTTKDVHGASLLRPAQPVDGSDPVVLAGLGQTARTMRVYIITGVPGVGAGVTAAYRDIPLGWNPSDYVLDMGSDPQGVLYDDIRESPFMQNKVASGVLWTIGHMFQNGNGYMTLSQITGVTPAFLPYELHAWSIAPPTADGKSTACAGLAVTKDQDVVVSLSHVSPTTYLSVYATGRRSYDPPNAALRPTRIVTKGVASIYAVPGSHARIDYCDAATAPDGKTVTFIGLYQRTYGWSSRVVPVDPRKYP